MSADLSCRIVATRTPGSSSWLFHLVNDGDREIETAALEAVKYEWGDQYAGGESPHARVSGLAPGAQAHVWTDDGSSEMRTDLWLRVTRDGSDVWLLFEFPKLYRQAGDTLTARGMEMPGPPSSDTIGPSR